MSLAFLLKPHSLFRPHIVGFSGRQGPFLAFDALFRTGVVGASSLSAPSPTREKNNKPSQSQPQTTSNRPNTPNSKNMAGDSPSRPSRTRFGLDVLSSSFEEVLPAVIDAINEAQFVAMDTELTGLSSVNNLEDITDEPRERYTKLKRFATDFAILQYGIACFRWNEEQKKYLVKPFNFYLSSATPKDTGIERRFLVQASSIAFLSEYKFDFNKAFHRGISYLSIEEEKAVRAKIPALRNMDFANSSNNATGNGSTAAPTVDVSEVNVDAAAKEVVDKNTALIDEWLTNSKDRTLTLPPCNGFLRRVLYQELPKKYGDQIHLASCDPQPPPPVPSRHKSLLVTRMSDPGERAALLEASQKDGADLLSKWVGFRKVIDALKGKPIIGHNMMLDLVHTTNKFHGGPLGNLDEWKGAILNIFGSVFDTKHIASSVPEIAEYLASFESGTGLSEVYDAFSKPWLKFEPAIELSTGFGSLGNDMFHDAAFDAFCTGLCFARMASFVDKYAGKMEDGAPKPHRDLALFEADKPDPSTVKEPPTVDGPILTPFKNFIHMMRSLTTAINIGGEDKLADLSHIFHIQYAKAPLPSPTPLASDVLSLLGKEFPDNTDLSPVFLKRVPFDDFSWIVTINKPELARTFSDKFLPPKPAEASDEMSDEMVTDIPLLGGSWKVMTMREYKDSKFGGYRKRGPPADEPSADSQGNGSQRRKVAE